MQSNDETESRSVSQGSGTNGTVTRRGFVKVGAGLLGAGGIAAIGLGAVGIGGVSGAQDGATPMATPMGDVDVDGDGFIEPYVLSSADGFLAVKLEAAPDAAAGPGRVAYERSVPGPTLRVRQGDQLEVALVNNLGGDETNLHVHGMHVSPKDNSDNIFVHVANGQTFNYSYAIPADHPPGLYWYHPHSHGDSSQQVSGGLAGAIIVEGALDDLPEIAALKDRLLVLQGPFLGPDHQVQYLVNGQINPEIPIRPGETQRWRILNASANAFFNLQLVRHPFHEIGTDGNPRPEVETKDILLLAPAERSEVLIQGDAPGIYELRSLAWAEDIPSQSQPQFVVATMVSGGEPVQAMALPTTLIDREDLSTATVDVERTIVFQENSAAPVFAIDGKAFAMDRVDQTVNLGALEEWTLRNASPEWHPFHIHVNDFQVMSRNGRPESRTYEDTSRIPPNGELIIRTRFTDFDGKFVYHCHILGHEDAGMMGVVEVVDPNA